MNNFYVYRIFSFTNWNFKANEAYFLPWLHISEQGDHLEPSQQANRQAPFCLCFHGNQSIFAQDVGDSCLLLWTAKLCIFFANQLFFRLWSETGFCLFFYFILFYFSMPSFTKAKTFAKCPLIYKICCISIYFFLLFLSTFIVYFFYYFYLLCNCCHGLSTALHLPPLSWILLLQKKKH